MPRVPSVVALSSVAFLAVVTTATRAQADPAHDFSLSWSAPAECPSRAEMVDRIARLVGPGTRPREPLTARAQIGASAGVLRADLELSAAGQRSSRHVEGDSCAAVSDALVLIVALAIDPEAVIPEPTATPPPRATPRPAPAGAAEANARAETGEPRRPFFVAAAARFDVSSLPAPAFGGEVAVGLRPRHFEVEVDGAILAATRATLEARPNEGADIRLTELGARGCGLLDVAPFEFGPCAGLHARWLSASGFGATSPSDGTALFGAVSLGALGTVRIHSRFALRVAADAVLPLSRPSFVIDTGVPPSAGGGAATVYQAPGAALRMVFGAELHF